MGPTKIVPDPLGMQTCRHHERKDGRGEANGQRPGEVRLLLGLRQLGHLGKDNLENIQTLLGPSPNVNVSNNRDTPEAKNVLSFPKRSRKQIISVSYPACS